MQQEQENPSINQAQNNYKVLFAIEVIENSGAKKCLLQFIQFYRN